MTGLFLPMTVVLPLASSMYTSSFGETEYVPACNVNVSDGLPIPLRKLNPVTSGFVNASDSRISGILHRADDLVNTGLLTILRVENTRHCRFDQKHDITGIRFAITIDKSEVAFDSSRIQDSRGNREVPSTVRLNTGHVITILVVRSRGIIQASAGEPSDRLPVIHWDETNDFAVIVRLIDHNIRELLTDVVNLDGDGTEQVGCDCHDLPHLEMPA